MMEKLVNLNDPESLYFLGFFWADGYISKKKQLYIEIKDSDSHILRNILSWNIYMRPKRDNDSQTVTLYKGGSKIYNTLVDYGYCDKNRGPTFLDQIPTNLLHLWYRGYLDGDGCIYYNAKNYISHVIFSSTYNQNWLFISKLCEQMDIKYHISQDIYKSQRSSKLRITKRSHIIQFGQYIYNQYPKLRLDRKYNKFLTMLD